MITDGPATEERPVITIGAMLPLSGDMAFIGESGRNSMDLALEGLKDTRFQYKIVYEDDKLDPKLTSSAAKKLIEVDKADAVVSLFSGAGNVVSPMAQESQVIHFSWASDPNVANGDYNFIHATPPSEEGKVWDEEAARRGVKRIALLTWQQAGGLAMAKGVKDSLKPGMTIVSEQTFNAGETDFKSMILKAKEQDPDIYMVLAIDPELPLIYKQMRELGIDKPVSGIEVFGFTKDIGLFEGQWYVDAAGSSDDFNARYENRYGKKPSSGGGNLYDMVDLIAKGFEDAGKEDGKKPSPELVVKELLKIQGFQGALGNLDMRADGTVWSKAQVKEIKDGKAVEVAR